MALKKALQVFIPLPLLSGAQVIGTAEPTPEPIACTRQLPESAVEGNRCAQVLVDDLGQVRKLHVTKGGSILALARDTFRVIGLFDDNEDNIISDTERVTLAEAPGLNHGMVVYEAGNSEAGKWLFASSASTVYRWPYREGMRSRISDDERVAVITNINADGQGGAPQGHTTRSLAVDDDYLYVAIGSVGNVDSDSYRSRIRRFPITNMISASGSASLPADFTQGNVFADGLRNEVGLAFDSNGVLWGVENGADRLNERGPGDPENYRADLPDVHNDNPAEEINRFWWSNKTKVSTYRESDSQRPIVNHFGYPYCWTEYLLGGDVSRGRGVGWAWPKFLNNAINNLETTLASGSEARATTDVTVTDRWCKEQVLQSSFALHAHWAPLGVTFSSDDSDMYVANHGSWNRDVPTGYNVVRIPMRRRTTTATEINGGAEWEAGDYEFSVNSTVGPTPFVFKSENASGGARWANGWRPVDVQFDAKGRLLISSDGTDGRGANIVIILEGRGVSRTWLPHTSCLIFALFAQSLVL